MPLRPWPHHPFARVGASVRPRSADSVVAWLSGCQAPQLDRLEKAYAYMMTREVRLRRSARSSLASVPPVEPYLLARSRRYGIADSWAFDD
jgi:hypothetical protein